MLSDSISVTYPAVHPGTEKTQIVFYQGTPDLSKIYTKDKIPRTRRIFVTDSVVAKLVCIQPFINLLEKRSDDVLIILKAGEKYKTIESVLEIVKKALENNFTRKDTFVAIGGGVICDMTAFAASLFKRGSRVEFVPTTLLAMVDAAIGGKTGCDFDNYKNMIGAFFPAAELHVFPQFIQSLDETQYRSGLAEAVKTALLYSKKCTSIFEDNKEKVLSRDPVLIDAIISNCIKAKSRVVKKDFTEKNIRMQLNFGHTFGHALETAAGLGCITHGAAVAWGISRAIALSEHIGLCDSSYKERVFKILSAYGWDTEAVPSVLNRKDASAQLLDAMKKDKKNTDSKIRVILQKDRGKTVIRDVDDIDILSVLH